jgi:hypothetical protein
MIAISTGLHGASQHIDKGPLSREKYSRDQNYACTAERQEFFPFIPCILVLLIDNKVHLTRSSCLASGSAPFGLLRSALRPSLAFESIMVCRLIVNDHLHQSTKTMN